MCFNNPFIYWVPSGETGAKDPAPQCRRGFPVLGPLGSPGPGPPVNGSSSGRASCAPCAAYQSLWAHGAWSVRGPARLPVRRRNPPLLRRRSRRCARRRYGTSSAHIRPGASWSSDAPRSSSLHHPAPPPAPTSRPTPSRPEFFSPPPPPALQPSEAPSRSGVPVFDFSFTRVLLPPKPPSPHF